jgi:hypothetical protein
LTLFTKHFDSIPFSDAGIFQSKTFLFIVAANKRVVYRWYNTTYIMFAVTNLLLLLLKGPTSLVDYLEANTLRDSVKKTIEILEAMDESVVARKSVEIVKSHFKEYCDEDDASQNQQQLNNEAGDIPQPDMAVNPEAFPFGGLSYGEFMPV